MLKNSGMALQSPQLLTGMGVLEGHHVDLRGVYECPQVTPSPTGSGEYQRASSGDYDVANMMASRKPPVPDRNGGLRGIRNDFTFEP